uniref:Uncharacterized protein n=1 Tax=Aegilops tauschii subsp. strangulata TaxID=200361 RepID=A0A453BI76_AEGTS
MIDYKLIYRSGTATAVLINGFHTPQGDKNARSDPFYFSFLLREKDIFLFPATMNQIVF